jgi:peptidoglycan/LPS O-acetylase OafA/YrhL
VSRRLPQLDGLRGAAVLLVIACHSGVPYIGPGGYLGVDVFFVLSGFLITGVLVGEREAHGRISLRRFYERRALRLYPALVALVVVLMPLGAWLSIDGSYGTWLRDAALSLTYTTDAAYLLHTEPFVGGLSHTWSLSIEEWFYVLWAPVVALLAWRLPRLDPRRGAVCTGVLAVVLLAITPLVREPAASGVAIYFRPEPRFGELLVGATLALALARPPAMLRPAADRAISIAGLAGAAAILAGAAYVVEPPNMPWKVQLLWIVVVALSAGAIVLRVVTSHRSRLSAVLSWRPLVYAGLISYSLYLWNFPVAQLRGHLPAGLREHAWVLLGVELAASFALATLSYRYVEQPFLRLKTRLRSTPMASLDEPRAAVSAATTPTSRPAG